MAEYKNPISITSQFSFCGLPLRLDTYSGCAFNCSYCFARLRGGNISSMNVAVADPLKIINKIKGAFQMEEKYTGVVSEFLRNRTPIHFGGMSDPFQPIERKKKVSLEILKYLMLIDYPVVISTRSSLLVESPYLDLLKGRANVVVQFSLSTINDVKAKLYEPLATPPSSILKTITILSKNNIRTSIRWQPYIPEISDRPSKFVSEVASTGIFHIGFEHLKLSVEMNSLEKYFQFDVKEFYTRNEAIKDGREYILPSSYKMSNVLEVKSQLSKSNITFGAADNDLQYLSDTDCCCSGVDQFPEFSNWNKFQIAHAIKKSRGKKIIFDSIESEWRPEGAIDKHINSDSRILRKFGHNTVYDYIKERWENLDSPFNPTKFMGVKFTGDSDKNGFKIYDWEVKKN